MPCYGNSLYFRKDRHGEEFYGPGAGNGLSGLAFYVAHQHNHRLSASLGKEFARQQGCKTGDGTG